MPPRARRGRVYARKAAKPTAEAAGKTKRRKKPSRADPAADTPFDRAQRRALADQLEALSPSGRLKQMLRIAGLPRFVPEHPFAKDIGRQWRFDLAWPERMLAVEVEGGIMRKRADARPCEKCGAYEKGAHGTAAGILRDIDKYNAGVMLGWRVLRIPTHRIDWRSVELIAQALSVRTFPGRRAEHGG